MNTIELFSIVALIVSFLFGGIVCWIDSFKMYYWFEKLSERFAGTGCIAIAIFFMIALIKAVMK